MAASNCHVQYASCMLIGVPLNAACQIVTNAPSVVMAGIVEVSGEVEREEGTDYSAKNFGGQSCGPELQGPARDKWMNLSGSMCLIDWGFMAATSGNPLVLDGDGNTVGYQELVSSAITDPCSDATQVPRLAMAIVRKAAVGDGGCAGVTSETGATGLVLHEFPNTTNWKWTDSGWRDERNLRNFEARGYSNPQIGAGPFNLWPADTDPNVIDPAAYHAEVFITGAGLPSAGCDPVLHPAPAVRDGDGTD
jgi:hypothetical protein